MMMYGSFIGSVVVFLQGVFISRVSEDGPAGKAGVLVGDKLLSVRSVKYFEEIL